MRPLFGELLAACRTVSRRPVYATTAIATIGLGIAITTVVFAIVNTVQFRLPPYKNPHDLVYVWNVMRSHAFADRIRSTYDEYDHLSQATTVFQSVAAFRPLAAILTGDGEPERLSAVAITQPMFDVLGVAPLIGRDFGDPERAEVPEVILSHDTWRRRFAGSADILGRQITITGRSHTVIGVMPASFKFPAPHESSQVWVALLAPRDVSARHERREFGIVARLAEGRSVSDARAAVDAWGQDLVRDEPALYEGWAKDVMNVTDFHVIEYRPLLGALGLGALLLFIAACLNASNIILANVIERTGEFAARSALGASRWRLMRQIACECVWLSAGGCAAGLLVALWSIEALVAWAPAVRLPMLADMQLDARVVVIAVAMAAIAAILSSIVPVVRVFGSAPKLSGATFRIIGSYSVTRWRNMLITAQVAFAVVLASGMAALLKSVSDTFGRDVGFAVEDRITFRLSVPANKYRDGQDLFRFYTEIESRVSTLPGVKAVGIASGIPMSSTGGQSVRVGAVGRSGVEPAEYHRVTAGFFSATGITLVQGRRFDAHDGSGSQIAIINEQAAHSLFGDKPSVGELITIEGGILDRSANRSTLTVVGVARDVRQYAAYMPQPPLVYVPMLQDPVRAVAAVVHAPNTPDTLAKQIRTIVATVDPDQPIHAVQSQRDIFDGVHSMLTFHAILFAVFGCSAILLVSLGLYGVITGAVAQQTREFGVRRALGAHRHHILRGVLSKSFWPVIIGMSIGLPTAWPLHQLLGASLELWLYAPVLEGPKIPFLVAAGVIAVTSLTAGSIPAIRATRIDPVVALRGDQE